MSNEMTAHQMKLTEQCDEIIASALTSARGRNVAAKLAAVVRETGRLAPHQMTSLQNLLRKVRGGRISHTMSMSQRGWSL